MDFIWPKLYHKKKQIRIEENKEELGKGKREKRKEARGKEARGKETVVRKTNENR